MVALSLIPRKSGERVKTNRRDTHRLCRPGPSFGQLYLKALFPVIDFREVPQFCHRAHFTGWHVSVPVIELCLPVR
jgi:hypothetical protein